MPIASFSQGNSAPRLGKVLESGLIDLSAAAPSLPTTMIGFLQAGPASIESFEAVGDEEHAIIPHSQVRLHAPISRPEKFLAIGMNYKSHAAEAAALGFKAPEYQLWFNKQVSCIVGPYDDVELPRVSSELDYEAELAVVIGKRCRHVPVKNARSVIAGYMICNDVSIRDWQRRSPTFTLGKSFDTHGPTGPWLTLDHEVSDPHDLALTLSLNGEMRQQSNTGNMIFNIYDQIAYLSTVMTLEPGDILATGTPSGVGVARTPPSFVKCGDVMRIDIQGLGHISNEVVAES
jgi:2-keto-4-pentenoate hydratase/2-oxohepta-3-ene-1,7-dioic acid hydratase in catechol pathway